MPGSTPRTLTPGGVGEERRTAVAEEEERERGSCQDFEDVCTSEDGTLLPPAPEPENDSANERRSAKDHGPEGKDAANTHSAVRLHQLRLHADLSRSRGRH